MIILAADHRGIRLKNEIISWLKDWEEEYIDLGPAEFDPEDDYSQIAINLGIKVKEERARGILVCGSGVGMSIAANKVDEIRAGLCTSKKQTKLAREDDDINVLCLSADLVGLEKNKEIVKTFIETVFCPEERYVRRINRIKEYEQHN